MNRLESLKKLAPLFIIIAIILVGAIGYLAISVYKKTAVPKKLPPPNIVLPPSITKPVLRNVIFNLNEIFLPPKVNVYKVASYNISETRSAEIAQSLEFRNVPKAETDKKGTTTLFWQNEDGTKSLSINLKTGYIEYTYSFTPYKVEVGRPKIPTVSNPAEAQEIARTFMTSHNLYPQDLEPSDGVTMLINSPDATPTKDIAKAYYFLVNFIRKIDGLTVYQQLSVNTSVSLYVDKYKNVARLSYQYPTIFGNTAKEFAIISIDSAKDKITKGEGTIVNFNPGEVDPKAKANMESAVLTSVDLAYFDDKTSGFIQPVYVFRGEATYKNFNNQPIVIYLPATGQ